jgi:predicted enzyme related to lactoylglutathione lyase
MTNDFGHIELSTSNLKEASAFYGSLFDWKMESQPIFNGKEYKMIKQEKGPNGGMVEMPNVQPPMWLVYITVDSVDDYLKKAIDLGAQQQLGKTEVRDMGWFAVLEDPQGAVFAIWENKPL